MNCASVQRSSPLLPPWYPCSVVTSLLNPSGYRELWIALIWFLCLRLLMWGSGKSSVNRGIGEKKSGHPLCDVPVSSHLPLAALRECTRPTVALPDVGRSTAVGTGFNS